MAGRRTGLLVARGSPALPVAVSSEVYMGLIGMIRVRMPQDTAGVLLGRTRRFGSDEQYLLVEDAAPVSLESVSGEVRASEKEMAALAEILVSDPAHLEIVGCFYADTSVGMYAPLRPLDALPGAFGIVGGLLLLVNPAMNEGAFYVLDGGDPAATGGFYEALPHRAARPQIPWGGSITNESAWLAKTFPHYSGRKPALGAALRLGDAPAPAPTPPASSPAPYKPEPSPEWSVAEQAEQAEQAAQATSEPPPEMTVPVPGLVPVAGQAPDNSRVGSAASGEGAGAGRRVGIMPARWQMAGARPQVAPIAAAPDSRAAGRQTQSGGGAALAAVLPSTPGPVRTRAGSDFPLPIWVVLVAVVLTAAASFGIAYLQSNGPFGGSGRTGYSGPVSQVLPVESSSPTGSESPSGASPAATVASPPSFTATPLLPTPTPPQLPAGVTVVADGDKLTLQDRDFTGGMSPSGGRYRGQTARLLTGQGTKYHTLITHFNFNRAAVGSIRFAGLTIRGVDSPDEAKAPIRVSLNGAVIYEGPDLLPNDDPPKVKGAGRLGELGWTIDPKLLRQGKNTLTISNISPGTDRHDPTYFVFDYAVIGWSK